jgi:RNA polymerase primary sigma factor
VRYLLDRAQEPMSLQVLVGGSGGDGDTEMADLIEDADVTQPIDVVTQQLMAAHVTRLIDGLAERDAEVVRMRFGLAGLEPRSLAFVSQQLGVTRERVRQIEKKVLAKLRIPELETYIRGGSAASGWGRPRMSRAAPPVVPGRSSASEARDPAHPLRTAPTSH